MTGLEYPGVTYAYFSAGYGREGSVSSDGALALASFGGRADWVRGSTTSEAATTVRIADWTELPLTPSVVLGSRPAQMLRRHSSGSTWMFDEAPTGTVPDDMALELFSLRDHTWVRLGAGGKIPALAPPVYGRIRSAAG
jgi:hypothetical protein